MNLYQGSINRMGEELSALVKQFSGDIHMSINDTLIASVKLELLSHKLSALATDALRKATKSLHSTEMDYTDAVKHIREKLEVLRTQMYPERKP